MKIYLILIFGLFIMGICGADTYYVNTASTGSGDGTTQELTGPYAAWKNIHEITGLSPGDTVLFHRGDTWTSTFTIPTSGEPNNIITFGAYGTGDDPLIDVSDYTYGVPAIALSGIDYVEIRNFRVKGNGGASAVIMSFGRGKDGSGALGDGYTVVIRDVNVLSNYGESEGSHDGFALSAVHPNGSSQALFYNITAAKCRHESEFGGSHQCLTLHQRCKAKVYTANFSDSVNWYVGTQDSQVEFYDLTARSSTSVGIVTPVGASAENLCVVRDSDLTADTGGKLVAVSDETSEEGPRIIIQDSYIKSVNSIPCINSGNITLERNIIDINDPNWRFDHKKGLLVLEDNTFICGEVRDQSGLFYTTSPGCIKASGNVFEINGTQSPIFRFKTAQEAGQSSEIRNNIFTNVSDCENVIKVEDDAYAPGIYNNVFYNSFAGGTAIDLEHDGDEASEMVLDLKNNIFCNIADVIDETAGSVYTSGYNCYYASEVLEDVGSITEEPLFVNTGYEDFHLKSEGWRWDRQREMWTWDNVTSRCIDAGNPGSPLADEPLTVPSDPNNEWGENLRINIGAYGGTVQASMPPYGWAILADFANYGTVDFKDFASLAEIWLRNESEQPQDLNRDGTIGINDLGLLAEDWLKQTTWFELP